MKTHKILLTALVAALFFAGCQKDNKTNRVLRIFAEDMTAGDSKLVMDPSDVSQIQWQNQDVIALNGQEFEIQGNTTQGYSVDINNIDFVGSDDAIYAIYPGGDFNGNDVDITGTNTNRTITLNELVVKLHNDNTQDVVFPMGTKAALDATSLTFKHLTAGFKLSLVANTSDEVVDQLKVIVYGESAFGTVASEGVNYTVKWANEGIMPYVPSGNVGDLTDQELYTYGSEMVFNMKSDGSDDVVFNSTAKSFCIPVTIGTVNRITVIGYNNGSQVFTKTSNLSTGFALERGKMYAVKTIEIN